MTSAFDEAASHIIEQYRREHAEMLKLLTRIHDHAAGQPKAAAAPLPRALVTEIARLIERLDGDATPARALNAA
jgi:hypothetical protein